MLILLCLCCKSQVIPLQIPCESHFPPIIGNGLTTDLQRTYNGLGTDLEGRTKNEQNRKNKKEKLYTFMK